MNTDTFNTETMKHDMKKALQQSNSTHPPTLSKLFELLRGAQEALRENGYAKAILELRPGLQSNYGLRYTAYFRDDASRFENPLFSIFIDGENCAFQAEGQIHSGLDADDMLDKAHQYLLRPYVVELMTGLLRQFSVDDSTRVLDTPSAA